MISREPVRAYPPAPRADSVDVIAGHPVPDPYRPLENPGDPATIAWSAAQEELFREHAAALPARERFRRRIADLMTTGHVGLPVPRGTAVFATRRLPAQEHATLTVTESDGSERVLIDPGALDPAGTTTLDMWIPSHEGHLLAYQLSHGGTEESVLRVLDTTTGADVDGPIDRTRDSGVAWLPGGRAFVYVRRLPPGAVPAGEEAYHRRVLLHRVGTSPDDDVELFGAGLDPTTYFTVHIDHIGHIGDAGRHLVVTAMRGTDPRTDVWITGTDDLDSPGGPVWRTVQEGLDAQTGAHVGRDGRLYLHTDLDAPRFRVCTTDPDAPGDPADWDELVPEDPGAVLEDFVHLDGGPAGVLLAAYTRHAVGELAVLDARTGARVADVPVPPLGSIGRLSAPPEGGTTAWFTHSDFTTPASVRQYDAATGATSLWAAAPGSPHVPRVHARLEEYTSKDGTTVRMFVVSPTGEPDVPRPAVLYGYGGFAIPMAPAYSPGLLAWVEAGGVYAVACLRGGSEEGEEWHRAGMGPRRQNVYDDFHAAAGHLLDRGWTAPGMLGISGGSNGGLLVGVALTQRPDLYQAVVCSAPLLDMARYELSGLGRLWSGEYGSASDPDGLATLLSYSPYHHVHDGEDYPAVLFTVFDADSRVDPLHARKMCAALQHATSGTRPVLLRAEADVGHAGRSVSRSAAVAADTLAFLHHWCTTTAPDRPLGGTSE